MELSGILKLARRWAFVLLGATVLAGMAGFAVSQNRADRYRATTQLLVGPITGDFQQLRAAAQLAETYAELVVSTRVLEQAADRAREPVAPSSLRQAVTARANDLTRILSITVTHPDPSLAAELANALGKELVELSRENRGVSDDDGPEDDAGSLRIVEPATTPTAAASVGTALVTALAALAGLGAALIAAIASDVLAGRLHEPADVEEITGGDCISVSAGRRRSWLFGRRRIVHGAYRVVAATLDANDGTSLRSLAIAPTTPGPTGQEVAIGVAESLGASGHDVVLVDAEASAGLTERLGLAGAPGLQESFTATDDVPNAFAPMRRPTNLPGVSVLSAGTRVLASVDRDQALKAVQRLLNEADRVVLSSGSPLVDNDCLVWARSVDGVLLVAVAERTRRHDLKSAAQALQLSGATVTATLLVQ